MTSLQKLSGINPQSNIHFDANNRFLFGGIPQGCELTWKLILKKIYDARL